MLSARGGGTLLAPLAAGFVCVLVGFTSSYPIVVAAAEAMGMTRDQLVTLTVAHGDFQIHVFDPCAVALPGGGRAHAWLACRVTTGDRLTGTVQLRR